MVDADQGQVDAGAAEVYETFFVPALFAQWPPLVLGAAGVSAGDRVLDVGCGTGVLARMALSWVGAEGKVTGVDPNPGMLAVARRSADRVEWVEGRGEGLPFGAGSFDRVVSQFALMFLFDREAGISEMRRVLRPGGGVAIATWAALDETQGYRAMVDLVGRLFGSSAAEAMRAPFMLGEHDEIRRLLDTGFDQVTVTTHPGVARFASIEAWVHTDIRGWTLGGMIDDERYQVLLREARRELAAFTTLDGAVEFATPAVIAMGTRGP